MSELSDFDAALARVTQDRGQHYGHPRDNFRRSDALKRIVQECSDPLARNALSMICEKIARLIQSPHHTDSWIDIAGYARTGVMCYSDTGERIAQWNAKISAEDKT